jgi:hypothetical protein
MQNCPSCQMLMEDHEALCPSCAAERAAASSFGPVVIGGHSSMTSGAAPAATAVLERPTAVPMPTTVRYRTPGEHRRVWVLAVVVLALLGGVVALGVMAMQGDGPLAQVAVDAGLAAPPVVDVPDEWVRRSSTEGAFRIEMPAGATDLKGLVDAANPASGSTYGFQTTFGQGGSTAVVSTDFGMAPGTLAAMDDPAAFGGLVDAMVSGLIAGTDQGEETVRREVPVGNGRAVDVVVVDDVAGTTTRARYLLADGRMYAVVTAGLDEGAEALDEVHARMLGSFETTA